MYEFSVEKLVLLILANISERSSRGGKKNLDFFMLRISFFFRMCNVVSWSALPILKSWSLLGKRWRYRKRYPFIGWPSSYIFFVFFFYIFCHVSRIINMPGTYIDMLAMSFQQSRSQI